MRYRGRMPGMAHGKARNIAAIMTGVFCSCLVAASLLSSSARADEALPPAIGFPGDPLPSAAPIPKRADFHKQAAPDAVKRAADWVTDSADNHGLPFVIVDKPQAKVFVFTKDGQLTGAASVLVGLAPGDDSVPGIGTMPLAQITPEMRTTPAGRFVSALGHDLGKLDVLWVDYADAISLHRVINTNLAERRLQRIVSRVPLEHRISYGCINVPAKFFDRFVDPAFKNTNGIVYILPEEKTMQDVFPTYYDVDDKAQQQAASLTEAASR